MNQLKVVKQHPISEFVFIEGNAVLTDSLTVALMFGKRHDNVRRDILDIVLKLDELKESEEVKKMGIDLSSLKFEECGYRAENGQIYQKYRLNFDEFMLVTMGYTTQKAMIVKIKYINEFNRMKEHIKSQTQQPQLPTTFAEALRLAADLEEEKQQLLIENKTMKPKAEYFDIVLDSTSTYTATQIANELGISSAKTLNKILHEKGVQRKVGRQWVLYAKHQGKGYIDTKTFSFDKTDGTKGSNQQLCWTEKGRKFIHDLINADKNNLQIM